MAHYALIDDNNKVVNVFVGKDENEDGTDWEAFYGNFHNMLCKRTSYNTKGGIHINGGTPFRVNYAGIGSTWDPNHGTDGAFIDPQPYPSWVLDTETLTWKAPIECPEPGKWIWVEQAKSWVEITN